MRAVPRLGIVDSGICFKTEGKSRKTLSQGIQKALSWLAPNAIRLVDLAIAGDGLTGLLAPAALGFRVRRRGQPSVSASIVSAGLP